MKEFTTITKELCDNNIIKDKEYIVDLVKEIQNSTDNIEKNDMYKKLITLHSKLIMKYVKKYVNYCDSLTEDDLFQAGTIGVIKAVEKFDTSTDNAFSTYVTWWIMQSITREINNTDKYIRFPVHIENKIKKISYIKSELTNKCEDFTNEEVLKLVNEKYKDENITMDDIFLYDTMSIVYSTDYTFENQNDKEETNIIKETKLISKENVFENVYHLLLSEELISAMKTILNEREFNILCERFGFTDGVCYTLDELSKKYEISREYVRQIECRAIKKLRNQLFNTP